MTRVLIIGGGIAGTLSALALRKAGIDSVVYEAYDRTADGVGAYLTLAVNALDALRALDLDGMVHELGFDTAGIRVTSGAGKTLAEFPYGPALPDGTLSQTVKRADLYRALREEAPTAQRGYRVRQATRRRRGHRPRRACPIRRPHHGRG
jgi:2-polyprenyl-6-methoxyphenol hydroxylase-like FAD-dependent oxidoreductase